jgi:diguanylate cyclase (GGDEF)-like protein/PAS domain S-box-containing protein
MNLFDMKTVIISYIISNSICAFVVTVLWIQNRRRFAGIGFWLADFVLQFIALILVVTRGVLPDLVSMTLSNSLIVGGTALLYEGLGRFVGKRSSQTHNIILFVVFVLSHAWFVIHPDLGMRNIIFSLGLLMICSQCAWLMLRRVDADVRSLTCGAGSLFALYCLVSIVRIVVVLKMPPGQNFFKGNLYDTSLVMLYQMLFIMLTFNLFLMVNRRLILSLELDIATRKQTESALRLSDEKFQKAFHSSPDSIIITQVSDGRIIEVNESFSRITGYSREEALGNSTITLELWANSKERESFVGALQERSSVWGVEYNYRSKYGKVLTGIMSAEIIRLGDVPHILSTIQDITERKQTEKALRESDERYQAFLSQSFEAIYRTEFDHPIDTTLPVETQIDMIYENAYMAECNQALADMYGLPSVDAMIGMRLIAAHGGKDNPLNRAAFRKFIEDGYKSVNDETVELDSFGNAVWFLSNTIGIIEEGYLIRMWGTSINITERKMAEIGLRDSEQRYQLIFDTMARGIVYQNADGYIFSANPAAERILGLTLDQMQGRTSLDPRWHAIHEDGTSFPGETHPSMVALQTGVPISGVVMGVFNPQFDEYRWISIDAVPQFRTGETVPYQVYATFDDITEQKQTDAAFQIRLKLFEISSSRSLEELMQKALDEICPVVNSPIGFYHFVETDQKTLSLQTWSTRTLNEFCKAEGSGLHYPIDQAGVWTDCIVEQKPVIHNDYPALPHRKGLPPGHANVIRELVVPILRNGCVVAILGVGNKPSIYTEKDARFVEYVADVIWEIVEHKRVEEKLRQLSRAVEQSPASIVITDTSGRIEYVNPRFTEVTGYSAEEAIGENPRILKTELTPQSTHRDLWKTVTAGRNWQGEFVNCKKNGELYYELASISPILDAQGSITHYVAVKENISERKESQLQLRAMNDQLTQQVRENLKLQEVLREQAIRDPLTHLYNRRYLDETIGRDLARAEREKYPVSFMMIDIDHFKGFNDTYGHTAGDKVLVALADLLRTHIRQGDIACRYGGEEFLIIMSEVGEMDAKRRAEEVCRGFSGLHTSYSGIELSATISIGIAFYPSHGSDAQSVIKIADAALYKAKQTGRNCTYLWGEDYESISL